MTVQFGNFAADLTQGAMQSRMQLQETLGDKRSITHLHPKDFASKCSVGPTEAERKWPPAWRLFLVAATRADLWSLILLALLFMGASQFLR
ncbi:MAG: hypothetical protein L0210_01335 [Rhodospirillales bacterium]|nr:hypothetical protein [Rhodospirillales bacterium]